MHAATMTGAALWDHAMLRYAARQGAKALVAGLSDDELADLVDAGPALPEPDDAVLVALDDRRIAADGPADPAPQAQV